MVRDALKVMKTTLDKVKGMVEFFHKSTRATEKLKSTQRQMDMPELRLKQDCATRWNSTLYMLKVLESKDAIISTLALINAHIDALDQEEWEALQETCTVLEPLSRSLWKSAQRGGGVIGPGMLNPNISPYTRLLMEEWKMDGGSLFLAIRKGVAEYMSL
ncbi:hypothetical protein NHX12_018120 [Muraenolepis orangiensis]|uniref:Uncharacterized protein n=1 Tax=Muraenolepis orangiensis TaxID=630683 RepID=A0A9Q0IYC1_9TELE|nr:hypothetical protein NHX12_018120 [Muraenolepis orangiensis]